MVKRRKKSACFLLCSLKAQLQSKSSTWHFSFSILHHSWDTDPLPSRLTVEIVLKNLHGCGFYKEASLLSCFLCDLIFFLSSSLFICIFFQGYKKQIFSELILVLPFLHSENICLPPAVCNTLERPK